MSLVYGLYLEIIWIVQMVFGNMFGFYSWNVWFRTFYTEFIHIECGLYRFYSDIMWFVQLFGLTFLLEGAVCVDLLCFFGPVSASSSFIFLFNLSSFCFSKSSLFLSSSSFLHSFLFLSSSSFLFSLLEHLLGSIPLSLPSPISSCPVNERETS